MKKPFYVIKLGSSTILGDQRIYKEILKIIDTQVPVLIVAGGGEAIQQKYESLGRPIPYLTLKSGERFRYCSPEEMPIIISAYEEIIGPALKKGLEEVGINPYIAVSGRNRLVQGTRSKALRTLHQGKEVLVRDSLIGHFHHVDRETLFSLLEKRRVVCLMPPIAEQGEANYLNIDADMLAASLSVALKAHHLRFVTGTSGILSKIEDQSSIIQNIYLNTELTSVSGRMKQKLRAARFAISDGIADVAITGSHMSSDGQPCTRFWPTTYPEGPLSLLGHASSIPSVSGDEAELAKFLKEYCHTLGIKAEIDSAGNFVARKGEGPEKLMLLGHLDTVPFVWKPQWESQHVGARGVVDAKGCLIHFIESLVATEVPNWGELIVVGATEEEVSSSKGAFYVRDHYSAKAVIVGEPSGSQNLTIGYFGLFKIKVRIRVPSGHSAGKEAISASDALIQIIDRLRMKLRNVDPAGTSALIYIRSDADTQFGYACAILDFRVSPHASIENMQNGISEFQNDSCDIEILRATPGVQTRRTTDLVKAFGRAFASQGVSPRYLLKKGSSDMNTLATTWNGIPMIAYGPGDSSLDHTDHEIIYAKEYQSARVVLNQAIQEWFLISRPTA